MEMMERKAALRTMGTGRADRFYRGAVEEWTMKMPRKSRTL